MSTQELLQKTALITGGGSGIGAAIAHRLAGLGATVIICGRKLDRLRETAEKIRGSGGQCEALACDVSDWDSVAALAARIQQTFGLDISLEYQNRPSPDSLVRLSLSNLV